MLPPTPFLCTTTVTFTANGNYGMIKLFALGPWNKESAEGSSFTSFLTLLNSFLSKDLVLRGQTPVQDCHKHCCSVIV